MHDFPDTEGSLGGQVCILGPLLLCLASGPSLDRYSGTALTPAPTVRSHLAHTVIDQVSAQFWVQIADSLLAPPHQGCPQ